MQSEKQLSIRSTTACDLVEALARRTGKSKKDVVLEALQNLHNLDSANDSPTHRHSGKTARFLESTKRIQAEVAGTGSSDHSFLYDDDGLPA